MTIHEKRLLFPETFSFEKVREFLGQFFQLAVTRIVGVNVEINGGKPEPMVLAHFTYFGVLKHHTFGLPMKATFSL